MSAVFTGESPNIEREKPIFFYRYFHEPVCMLREGDWVMLGYEEHLPWQENYNESELGKIKPDPGEPRWAQWGYNESHHAEVVNTIPGIFELYNIREDRAQKNNLVDEFPERAEEMNKTLLELRNEMIREGGNWFRKH
jgi:arylsulfatase A